MDKKILKELYERYHKELFLYIYSMCKNRELSQDIIQDTFLKAILSVPQNHTNLRAWLYTVARNLYLNHTRHKNKKTSLDEIKDLPANDIDPVEILIRNEAKRLCFEAVKNLNGTKKEVIILQYFANLSQNEIASVLRITPENVRVLSYRGKKELRKYMEVNGYDI